MRIKSKKTTGFNHNGLVSTLFLKAMGLNIWNLLIILLTLQK